MDDSADEVGAMVVDVGFSTSKFGYAGQDFPKAVVSSVRLPRLLPPPRSSLLLIDDANLNE